MKFFMVFSRDAKMVLKKKTGTLALLDIKRFCKITAVRRYDYWHRCEQIGHRTEI